MQLKLIAILLLVHISTSHSCIGIDGKAVSWWVQMIFPGTFSNGFGYMDSEDQNSVFTVHREKADSQFTALTRTLTQINQLQLQSIAWNDEWPDGKTSSTKAHSKGVLAFDEEYQSGFYFGHSIPQFPQFINETINTTIKQNQSIYGQHTICISLDSDILKDMLKKTLPMKPYFYQRNVDEKVLAKIISSGALPDYKSLFSYRDYTVGKTNIKMIFKNGAINGSIFEDGMSEMLQSSMIAQTWGRPLEQPYCGDDFDVDNVKTVMFDSKISWSETKDHSKWAYAVDKNFACFGDMNRMTSQWKRGGAFYCLEEPRLKAALKSVVKSFDLTCAEMREQKKYRYYSQILSVIGLAVAGFVIVLQGRL